MSDSEPKMLCFHCQVLDIYRRREDHGEPALDMLDQLLQVIADLLKERCPGDDVRFEYVKEVFRRLADQTGFEAEIQELKITAQERMQ